MKITFTTPQGNIHYTNQLISLQQTADNNEQLMDDWVRWQINIIWLNIVKYTPMKGSSYIQLPK